MANDIHSIANHLNQLGGTSSTGLVFDSQPISGEVDVLQVTVEGREELPIFVSISAEQIICICYMWGEDEVKAESRSQMLEFMLELNIPMPLSSFAKVGDKYVVFGALSINSSLEDIEHELAVLSHNSVELIDDMDEYLN